MDIGGDGRGQSVIIGSLLVFTILVLSFSAYQAFAVPNQNAEVEADHFQDVSDDFSQFQSSVINAVGSDEARSTPIKLGVRYPTRTFALNPPPAAGKLETTEAGDVSIVEAGTTLDVCSESGVTPTTRSLVYTPSYNEYQPPQTLGYETRVFSREYESGSLYDQRFVFSSNNRINLFLLTGEVSENGIDTYNLEVNGSSRNTVTLTNPVITIPSRFDAATWNSEILQAQSDVTATPDPTTGRVSLTFTGGDYEFTCAVVGLDGAPDFSPPAGGGGGGGGGGSTNPSSEQETLVWKSATIGNTEEKPSVTFENTGTSPISIQEVRYQFYDKDSQGGGSGGGQGRTGTPNALRITDTATSDWVNYIQPFKDVSTSITDIPGGSSATYVFEFNKETDGTGNTFDVESNDFFVITIKFTINGETKQATYFIGVSQP